MKFKLPIGGKLKIPKKEKKQTPPPAPEPEEVVEEGIGEEVSETKITESPQSKGGGIGGMLGKITSIIPKKEKKQAPPPAPKPEQEIIEETETEFEDTENVQQPKIEYDDEEIRITPVSKYRKKRKEKNHYCCTSCDNCFCRNMVCRHYS